MVELMLHDTSQIAFYPLVVRLQLFVEPLYTDAGRTNDFLVNGRQRQATFF